MSALPHVLVVGANGFVGRATCAALKKRGTLVRAAIRGSSPPVVGAEFVTIRDVGPATDWRMALDSVDAVVHLAARVHVMDEQNADALAEFRRVNVLGTMALARQAAEAGVRRFIFISSIKVNGESTVQGRPFVADDTPAPEDFYGVSKAEAEAGLLRLAAETGMEVVVIRPPLVYGPNVKGNFASMMHWLAKGVPLPLGSVTHNRRSMVALDNLVDLIVTCLRHPKAVNQVFLVSDGEDLSTAEMLCRLSKALGRPALLLPLPAEILKMLAWLIGKQAIAQRLLGSLQVDIAKTRELLEWVPHVSVDEGLRRAAKSMWR